MIEGTNDPLTGVAAEHAWLGARFPRIRQLRQALTSCGESRVDLLEVTTLDGTKRVFYFDVTSFFGDRALTLRSTPSPESNRTPPAPQATAYDSAPQP